MDHIPKLLVNPIKNLLLNYLSPYTHLIDTITESFTEILTETHLIADVHILSLTELYIESLKELEMV
jgi:hypothetical protein